MTRKSVQVANLIKEKRSEMSMSQEALAEALGFSLNGGPQTISNIERGNAQFPLKHANKLCETLKMDTATLRALFVADYAARVDSQMAWYAVNFKKE